MYRVTGARSLVLDVGSIPESSFYNNIPGISVYGFESGLIYEKH